MGLYFKNARGDNIHVAYAYHSPGCEDGGEWAKKGWYLIAPGRTVKVFSGFAGPGKYFAFAENESQTWSAAGPFFTQLPSSAFDWCWSTGSSDSRVLGLFKFEVGWGTLDYTVSLH
jgi:hypothetical protein